MLKMLAIGQIASVRVISTQYYTLMKQAQSAAAVNTNLTTDLIKTKLLISTGAKKFHLSPGKRQLQKLVFFSAQYRFSYSDIIAFTTSQCNVKHMKDGVFLRVSDIQ